jgi:hypothetical protein
VQRTNILEIRTLEECRAVLAQEFAIVFKHSKFCGVSHDAYQTICDFCADNPTFVVYLISVTVFWRWAGSWQRKPAFPIALHKYLPCKTES